VRYSFDTSALIDLGERHYPERLRVFAPIWNYIYTGIDYGNIVSVDIVKEELEKKADDWRSDFLIRANVMFLMNPGIEAEYAGVIKDIESSAGFKKNNHRKRFMSGADPWIIAQARNIGNCTVISAETKSLTDYGLGPVCGLLGVRHLNLVRFFEENNIGAQ
jgi:hypothetical protein